MSEKIVELIRRFKLLSSPLSGWDVSLMQSGETQRWNDLEDEHRVLILAAPGAGKTFEAKTRANKIRERGKKAFFIRIESIDANFHQAFEIGSAEEFETWRYSTEDAWFFLDSVDEAQLETPSAFEDAIRLFGLRIYGARERARVFITSREDAWQSLPDQTLIEQILPHGAPRSEEPKDDLRRKSDPMLKTFRLQGLSRGCYVLSGWLDSYRRA